MRIGNKRGEKVESNNDYAPLVTTEEKTASHRAQMSTKLSKLQQLY